MKPFSRLATTLASMPRDTRDTLFLLAVIAWTVLPHAPQLPAWTTALVAGVLLWRGWIALAARKLPLVVWGGADRIVTPRLARRTASALDAPLLVLPGTGHVAQIERPEEVARAVAGLWDSGDARIGEDADVRVR